MREGFCPFFLVATSPADQQRTAVNSPASMQDNYEAMTPTQASMNQQQLATNNLNGMIQCISFVWEYVDF